MMVSLWLNNAEAKYLYLLLLDDDFNDTPVSYEFREKLQRKLNSLMNQNRIEVPGCGEWEAMGKNAYRPRDYEER
jgi:hypothetical protein